MPVSLKHEIMSGKCCNQHKQGRLWQMKIRQQCLNRPKSISRPDSKSGEIIPGLYETRIINC
jgi:hypothetical protein